MDVANGGLVPDKFKRGEEMSLYNPAADPSVINGVQEAYGFKIGDLVEYTNPDGMVFAPRIVVGFVQNPDPSFLPENTVYIDSDSPWYPVKPSSLRKIDACEECAPCKGTRTKQDQELNCARWCLNRFALFYQMPIDTAIIHISGKHGAKLNWEVLTNTAVVRVRIRVNRKSILRKRQDKICLPLSQCHMLLSS